jgi:hypothetical protein
MGARPIGSRLAVRQSDRVLVHEVVTAVTAVATTA